MFIDQWGSLDAWDGTNSRLLLSTANLPVGINLVGPEGVQNVAANDGDPYLVWADIGERTAEEVDAIRVDDLFAGGVPLNYGWGRNAADGKAREGTFYVDAAHRVRSR